MVNDNVYYVLVEKLDSSHDSVNAVKTSGSIVDLAEGQIALVTEAGVCTATSKTGTGYKLARKINGKLEFTPDFLPENVISLNTAAYSAPTNKIQALGYNGTSGSFVVADSTVYTVNILLKDTHTTFGNKEMFKFGTYKTGVSATGLEAAIGLVDNLIKNFSREPEEMISFKVLSSYAGDAITHTVAVVKDTDIITFTSGEIVAGDYVRLGTAVTANVYKVVSLLTATTAKLDRVVIEATSSISSEKVTANDNAGIVFTGVDKSRFEAGLWKFEVSDFEVMPISGVADVSTSQSASLGLGAWQLVAEDEWFAQGNRGYGTRIDSMIPFSGPKMGVEESRNYDALTLKFKDQRFTNIVGQSPASIISATVYGSTETVAALKASIQYALVP
jgi:hypothetical protein